MNPDYELLDEDDSRLSQVEQQMDNAGKSWPRKFEEQKYVPGGCPNCSSGTLKVAYSDMAPPALQCTNYTEPKSEYRHETDGGTQREECTFRFINADLF